MDIDTTSLTLLELEPWREGRVLYKPFEDSDRFNDRWWSDYLTDYRPDRDLFFALRHGEQEVARIEVELSDPSNADYGFKPAGPCAIIRFIEVAGGLECKGIGTRAVSLLSDAVQARHLVAFSEGADGFWSTLGCDRYDHPDGRLFQPMFVGNLG